MRPAERIPEVLNTLSAVWQLYPDLRLGQLLWSIAGGDPFYMEDDELIKKLKARAEQYVYEKSESNGKPIDDAGTTPEWIMPLLRENSRAV